MEHSTRASSIIRGGFFVKFYEWYRPRLARWIILAWQAMRRRLECDAVIARSVAVRCDADPESASSTGTNKTFIWSSTLSYRPANICLSQTRHSHSASSSRWLARQRSDPFVRDRAQSDDGAGPYRSRAAFKLLEIQRKYKILRKGFVVVDLGCAPGSWLQVASRAVGVGEGSGRVVGIDLLAVGSIPGVDTIRGDFLDAGTRGHLVKLLESSTSPGQVEEPVVDVVLSDMAANVTGNRTTDVMNTLNLCEAAYVFAAQYLRLGGSHLVMKYFTHPTLQDFKQQYLVPSFKEFKPKASRSESSECYWVCLDWKGVPP